MARYWQFASEQILDFRTATAVVGASWPYQRQVLTAQDVPGRRRVPREGATAWADSWLLAKQAKHPNCAYLWLRHVLTADVQSAQSLLLRESPVNPLACPLMEATEEGSCAAYYGAAPAALLKRLVFWKTPSARCGSAAARTACPTSAGSRRGRTSSVDNRVVGQRRGGREMAVTVAKHKNLIGGKWVDAVDGQTMEVFNPSTGEVIAEVPRCSAEDVEQAIDAGKAWDEWQSKTPKDRMELLLALADVMEQNAEELWQLESQNVGKPAAIARDEIPFSVDNLASSPGRPATSRESPRRSTSRATRRSSAASRSASSPASRPGTTR